jgi:hypothetical protein
MIVTEEIGTKPLADLVRQVQAGDEILLTQNSSLNFCTSSQTSAGLHRR